MVTVAEIRKAIKERKVRSAWGKGVNLYALDFLDDVKELRKLDETDELEPVEMNVLLNGARGWQEYSESGNSLIYDEDICKRLCPPSEQKKKKDGELPPNSRETWIDVQARALRQASHILRHVIAAYKRKEG